MGKVLDQYYCLSMRCTSLATLYSLAKLFYYTIYNIYASIVNNLSLDTSIMVQLYWLTFLMLARLLTWYIDHGNILFCMLLVEVYLYLLYASCCLGMLHHKCRCIGNLDVFISNRVVFSHQICLLCIRMVCWMKYRW